MLPYQKFVGKSAILLACIALSIFVLDRPLATFLHQYGRSLYEPAGAFTKFCDFLFTNTLYVWGVLAGIGTVLLFLQKNKLYGAVFFVVILVNISSSYLTSTLKATTERSRPLHYFKNEKTPDFFNREVKGYSFPSGHASAYWSLFLPFAMVFRRYAGFLLIVPFLISASRMAQDFHYLSDVTTSYLLVWWISSLLLALPIRFLNTQKTTAEG
jgi:membrane-associated phospholipid phosphatase